jgi:hypothetical protein
VVAGDPSSDDPHRHVLAQSKGSLGSARALVYRTVQRAGTRVVEWLGPSPSAAADLTGAGQAGGLALQEAAYALYSILQDGPVPANEVIRWARQAGSAKRTLDRAKKLLGVLSSKEGSGRGSKWTWELPEDEVRLRPYRDRDHHERLLRARGEVAGRRPGDVWAPPARDAEVYLEALAERGLAVVRVGRRDHLLRAEDVGRVPLLEQLARDSLQGDAAAEAAYLDLLDELGFQADQLSW